jgi:hypothetical protein
MAETAKVVRCPPSTSIERLVGFLAASVFSVTYYAAPIYVLAAPVMICIAPSNVTTWICLTPLILSLIIPSRQNKFVFNSWAFRQIPKYFDYTEILEFSDEEAIEYTKTRPTIFAVCPHGVISFAGICSGIIDYGSGLRFKVLDSFPTAVADDVMRMPILKHVIGIFGLIDASKNSLTKRIKKGKSFVLYPGGIAELFLSSPKEERIFARKGFIKLALTTGADVVPIYLFGEGQS